MAPLLTRRPPWMWRAGAALALLALLAGCAWGDDEETQAAAQAREQAQARAREVARHGILDPYRQMLVIGPSARFNPAQLPDHWYAATSGGGPTNITTGRKDGVFALRLEGTGEGAILGRRVEVPLLNMPYLRWGWYVERLAPAAKRTALRAGEPAVLLRVVVGLRDTGDAGDADADPHGPPKIDRAISLEWRADNSAAPGDPGSVVMRAGFKDAGDWMLEAVDLTRIYSKAWPQSPIANARIAFVAVGAGPTPIPTAGYVAEVVLSP